jgi:hypothetical protein
MSTFIDAASALGRHEDSHDHYLEIRKIKSGHILGLVTLTQHHSSYIAVRTDSIEIQEICAHQSG